MIAQFPDKLRFLFNPARYKIAHGGRGSAKSWGFARALLILGAQKKLRILCAREIQRSIADSVHKLLNDQIQALNLNSLYEVQQNCIKGSNGTEFIFAGLGTQTAESIKSYEGVDICWVEEGQNVSKRSWDILTPTIRKAGSEIWVSFNPDLDTDETWKRFVKNPPAGAEVCQLNWRDNPWFPPELEAERLSTQARDPEGYDNIWEGVPRTTVDGAIYTVEIPAVLTSDRFTHIPHNPALRVHTIWDLGWNDSMAIIIAQRNGSGLYIIDYISDNNKTLADYVSLLDELPKKHNVSAFNWGVDWIPHDGANKDFKTGKSTEQILLELGRKDVRIIPKQNIEEGIRLAKLTFPRVYFDKKAEGLLESLRRYRRLINKSTGTAAAPLHDDASHGADAFRYLAAIADQMTNENWSNLNIKYRALGLK